LQDEKLAIVVDKQPIVINCDDTDDEEEHVPLKVREQLAVALALSYKSGHKVYADILIVGFLVTSGRAAMEGGQ
jgi:hypothetical protein